jgi:Leucine-rich repeat (LRR) protein
LCVILPFFFFLPPPSRLSFSLSNKKALSVESNRLTSLPASFEQGLKSLKILNCSQNAITSPRFPSLAHCKQLAEVDVSQNKLAKWPELPLEHGTLAKVVDQSALVCE